MSKVRLTVRAKLYMGFLFFYVASGLLPGYLAYLINLMDVEQETANWLVVLVTLPVIALLFVITGLYLRKWITRPMSKLNDAARALASGKVDVDLQFNTGDEMESLAASLSRMKSSLRIAHDWLGPPELEEYLEEDIRGLNITERIFFWLIIFLVAQPIISILAVELSGYSDIAQAYWSLVLSIMFLIVIVHYLSSKITSPITALAERAEKVSHGDFSINIEVTQPGDIGTLERNFRMIIDRVRKAMKELGMDG
jgi:nitrogen fixation/metabolism regulation signal transduction histidine kinase